MNGTRRIFVAWLASSRGLLLSLTCLAAPAVLAQDAPPPAAATPPPAAEPETPKIDVTAFVDVYYECNFDKVDPALRTFDSQHAVLFGVVYTFDGKI